ncbi:unannotated protein [freshwater metagenome]|uniref:Unannotated protein n=1 Tax=freshwater metagenome TaxID=449393 RepID=A0A6J6M1B7_9ZZZZ|nr:hypothetical protein [Actinomycetota bacterium]
MRRSIDVVQIELDDMPEGLDDPTPVAWTVAVSDDYDDAEPRVQLTVERIGEAGEGLVAHLSASNARRLRKALADALREVGEPTE